MCYKIESEVIIANFFAECEGVTELKLSLLSKIKEEIEEKFKNAEKFLFIDTSRSSIMNAVYSNPKYFSFDESRSSVVFNDSRINSFYEDVYGIFNSKIDLKIKFLFLNILENILEKYSVTVPD